jgi:hypothetical protein
MKWHRAVLAATFVLLVFASGQPAQTEKPRNAATAPPKILLLVHQQFKFGSESARQKLEVRMTRASNRLDVPNSWIDLESLSGPPEALFFDPLDSFKQLEDAFLAWGQLFASHPEVAHLQEQIRALESSESTVIAVRRDDLGYRVSRIDLSKVRFLRVQEVRLRPGHESDFVDASKLLGAAYEKLDADMPWVVYQTNVGMPSPSFLVFVPMHALKENDGYLARAPKLREAEGEEGFGRMQQIAQGAYASTESNLYSVSPEMSHVPKEIVDGDPDFWSPKPSANSETSAKRSGEEPRAKGFAEKPEALGQKPLPE